MQNNLPCEFHYFRKKCMSEKSKCILVVDDEPDVTELVKYKLEQEGYHCEILNNPLSFVSKAREISPDLILLDIMMPELNGLQLCKIIRSDPKMRSTPIIFLTARGEAEDRVKGLESGADDYVAKPFNTKELILRVGKCSVVGICNTSILRKIVCRLEA